MLELTLSFRKLSLTNLQNILIPTLEISEKIGKEVTN